MTHPEAPPKDQTQEIWETYRKRQLRKKIPLKIAIALGTAVFLLILCLGVYIVVM